MRELREYIYALRVVDLSFTLPRKIANHIAPSSSVALRARAMLRASVLIGGPHSSSPFRCSLPFSLHSDPICQRKTDRGARTAKTGI